MKKNILYVIGLILLSIVCYKIIFLSRVSNQIVKDRTAFNRGVELSQEGYNYFESKQYKNAIIALGKSVELLRENWRVYSVHNNLAWILATCPDSQLRNGELALYHAKIACEKTGYREWEYLDTLAVAYAEAGNFEDAIVWAEKASALTEDINAKGRIEERLKLYRTNKAFHEKEKEDSEEKEQTLR